MDDRSALSLPLLLLLLVLRADSVPAGSTSQNNRIEDCTNFQTMRYYQELGCVPSGASTGCSPESYNCTAFLSLDKTKCHYRGKAYEPGTYLQDEIKSKCTPGCHCSAGVGDSGADEASFQCAHVDCPEYFSSGQLEPGCFRQYNVDDCCSVGVHCSNGTDSARSLTQCTYNGVTYLEGQHMDVPGNDCVSCVCQPGFDGTLDGPWCRKFSCDFTFRQRLTDLARCAPVYHESSTCCPITWHCPSGSDTVVMSTAYSNGTVGHCNFGEHNLNVGDQLSTDNPCVRCRCDIPPFITCTQRLQCP